MGSRVGVSTHRLVCNLAVVILHPLAHVEKLIDADVDVEPLNDFLEPSEVKEPRAVLIGRLEGRLDQLQQPKPVVRHVALGMALLQQRSLASSALGWLGYPLGSGS